MQREVDFNIENSVARLRPATPADLDFIVATETANVPFIGTWTHEQHLAAQAAPDSAELIIEDAASGQAVGYMILGEINSPHDGLEFRRVAVTAKGKGYGRAALQLLKTLAFGRLNAHRLWLDVKDFNTRARTLYKSEGFSEEGVLRDCLKTADGYESLVVMSLLRSEYDGQLAEQHLTI
jgi:diamine N-acetyltransferase